MKENILKKGVISFAPDDESTNVLGIVTDSYNFNGNVQYDIHTEVAREINSGLTPEQALYEWDL